MLCTEKEYCESKREFVNVAKKNNLLRNIYIYVKAKKKEKKN